MASIADKFELYEQSVQCPESEIDFVDEQFKTLRKRDASHLREDFCGTAQNCIEWISRRKSNIAIGIDLDKEVISWCKVNKLDKLRKSQLEKINLIHGDVLNVKTDKQDLILATNFSYWCFKERCQLARYFSNVSDCLVEDGVFVLDCYGGYDTYKILSETTEYPGFTYVWEQADFNPVNNHQICHIHYKFSDKSQLDRAFTYNWRVWSIREIREILADSGFSQSLVFWQNWDDDVDEAANDFHVCEKADPDAGWIAYVVALK